MHHEKTSAAETSGVLKKSERALCQKTLEDLKELGLDVGPLFVPRSQGLGGVSTRLFSGIDFRLDDAGNGWTGPLSQNPRATTR